MTFGLTFGQVFSIVLVALLALWGYWEIRTLGGRWVSHRRAKRAMHAQLHEILEVNRDQ